MLRPLWLLGAPRAQELRVVAAGVGHLLARVVLKRTALGEQQVSRVDGKFGLALIVTLGVGVLLPLVGMLLARELAAAWSWDSIQIHTAVEVSGALIALGLAATLLELRAAREGTIDVIVADIRLPDMAGPDLVARVREHTPASVVYVSGLSREDSVVQQALEAPDTAFVPKPADFDEIEREVNEALARAKGPEASPPDSCTRPL